MNPRKRIKYIEKESFNKPKIYYQKINNPIPETAPIFLNLEEYEALRLYHYKHWTQAECAAKLRVSQPTFSRILRSGTEKIVKALVEEKNFEILGGNVIYREWTGYSCFDCDYEWEELNAPDVCPKCQGKKIFKLKKLVSFFAD